MPAVFVKSQNAYDHWKNNWPIELQENVLGKFG